MYVFVTVLPYYVYEVSVYAVRHSDDGRAGSSSGAPGRGRILTGMRRVSATPRSAGGCARSCTALVPREVGEGGDGRRTRDGETVACGCRL